MMATPRAAQRGSQCAAMRNLLEASAAVIQRRALIPPQHNESNGLLDERRCQSSYLSARERVSILRQMSKSAFNSPALSELVWSIFDPSPSRCGSISALIRANKTSSSFSSFGSFFPRSSRRRQRGEEGKVWRLLNAHLSLLCGCCSSGSSQLSPHWISCRRALTRAARRQSPWD